jgi:hypothetical protein
MANTSTLGHMRLISALGWVVATPARRLSAAWANSMGHLRRHLKPRGVDTLRIWANRRPRRALTRWSRLPEKRGGQ